MNKFIDFAAAVAAWQINKNETAMLYDCEDKIWNVDFVGDIGSPVENTKIALVSGGLSESKINELMSDYVPTYPKRELFLLIDKTGNYHLYGDVNGGFFHIQFGCEVATRMYCDIRNITIVSTRDHR